MRIAFATLLLAFAVPLLASEPFEIAIWPGIAPGSENSSVQEVYTDRPVNDGSNARRDRAVTGVTKPTLTVYLPPEAKRTGVAVVVCPGGGFTHLAIDKEGHDVARWLARRGIAGVVVKYRTPDPKAGLYVTNGAAADVARAIRIVRHHGAEWGVDPARIGVMGFSAGGYLAALAGTRFDTGDRRAADPINQQSSRPDFLTLVYPLVSLVRHSGRNRARVERMLGPEANLATIERYSPEKQVTPATPRAFLVQADDDHLTPEHSVGFYEALHEAGVRAELHVYSRGGHGFGIRARGLPASNWKDRWVEWLRTEGFLGAEPGPSRPSADIPHSRAKFPRTGTLALRLRASRLLVPGGERASVNLVSSAGLRAAITRTPAQLQLDLTLDGAGGPPLSGNALLSHLKADRWYHLAVAWDRPARRVELYLNGVLQQSIRLWVDSGRLEDTAPVFGGTLGGGAGAVTFTVDTVRWYERFLREEQLATALRGSSLPALEGEGRSPYKGALDLSDYQTELLYEADFSKKLNVVNELDLFDGDRRARQPRTAEWVLEGDGRAWTEGGSAHVETTGNRNDGHLVLWNTRRFPDNVLIEWEVSPLDSMHGLTILFFSTTPKDNHAGSIFDLSLPKRDGLFKNYHSGALNGYHLSYWAGDRRTANLRKNHGFLLLSAGIDRIMGQSPGPHLVRLLKVGGQIQLEANGRTSVVYNDNGTAGGPVWTDGYIGLRQMGHTKEMSSASFKVYQVKQRAGD